MSHAIFLFRTNRKLFGHAGRVVAINFQKCQEKNMMRVRLYVQAVVLALLAVALPANLAASTQRKSSTAGAADPISGRWSASFEFAGGNPFAQTLRLKLEGKKVSGSTEASHTGGGTITGTWEAGELNIAIEGERGTMALTGRLKEGKLAGDWDVGHAKGKWEAKKK
jgi:hypothetical protein